MAKDPVCNMNVDEKTAKYTSELNGQKVYLCRAECKENFDQILQNMDVKSSHQYMK